MKTGYCAANYSKTDLYNRPDCGPIRDTADEAMNDSCELEAEGVRWVAADGFLYVDAPEDE